MFGLDDRIASISDGGAVAIVIVVAILLGLRHATDPDHLAAVTTLIASGKDRAAQAARRLGFFWGLGHAATLFAFGLPIILLNSYLPERVEQLAESAIAVVIVVIAVRLIYRWRQGFFHAHPHEHEDGARHLHLHSHAEARRHEHPHRAARTRTPLGAFTIGLVHGMGGSAGVGVLILASIESTVLGVVALALLAIFTAVSMWFLTAGFGFTLASRPVRSAFAGIAPAIGMLSLAFGVWYGTAAWDVAWYPF